MNNIERAKLMSHRVARQIIAVNSSNMPQMEKWTLSFLENKDVIEWESNTFSDEEPNRGRIEFKIGDPNFLIFCRISVIIASHHDLIRISDETTKNGRVIILQSHKE